MQYLLPKKGKNKGASRYLLYPEHTILNSIAQDSLLEIDFIGKFIQGRTGSINFLGFSLRGKHSLKYFTRVASFYQEEVMARLDQFITCFEKHYATKMDNAFPLFGPPSKERFLSNVFLFAVKSCKLLS